MKIKTYPQVLMMIPQKILRANQARMKVVQETVMWSTASKFRLLMRNT